MDTIKFQRIRPVTIPTRSYNNDAGLDFYIPKDTDMDLLSIWPGENTKIPSGIIIDIPPGWVGIFLDRSSIANDHGLLVGAKVIDSGYKGELNICLHNVGSTLVELSPDQKVVQLVLIPIATPLLEEVETVIHNQGERGNNGFGSTNGGE